MAGTKDDAVRANDGNQGLNPDPATKRSLSDVRFAFGPGTRFWVIVDGEWKLYDSVGLVLHLITDHVVQHASILAQLAF